MFTSNEKILVNDGLLCYSTKLDVIVSSVHNALGSNNKFRLSRVSNMSLRERIK